MNYSWTYMQTKNITMRSVDTITFLLWTAVNQSTSRFFGCKIYCHPCLCNLSLKLQQVKSVVHTKEEQLSVYSYLFMMQWCLHVSPVLSCHHYIILLTYNFTGQLVGLDKSEVWDYPFLKQQWNGPGLLGLHFIKIILILKLVITKLIDK